MMDGFFLAFQFLTRLPIRRKLEFTGSKLAQASFFFPLVGLVLGLMAGGVGWIFSHLSRDLGAFMALLTMVILTGGLHLDGLADSLDGLLSYRDRRKTLEIMADSRIGAFGVLGLIMTLLLKYLLIRDIEGSWPLFLGLAMANSRLVVSYLMAFKRTGKKEGLGHSFTEASSSKYFIGSALLYLIFLSYLGPYLILGLVGNFLLSSYFTRLVYRRIGGYTGDLYGMMIELGELGSLLTYVGVIKCGL